MATPKNSTEEVFGICYWSSAPVHLVAKSEVCRLLFQSEVHRAIVPGVVVHFVVFAFHDARPCVTSVRWRTLLAVDNPYKTAFLTSIEASSKVFRLQYVASSC